MLTADQIGEALEETDAAHYYCLLCTYRVSCCQTALIASPDAATLLGFPFPSSQQAAISVAQSSAAPIFSDGGLSLADNTLLNRKTHLNIIPWHQETPWLQASDPGERLQELSRGCNTTFVLDYAHHSS